MSMRTIGRLILPLLAAAVLAACSADRVDPADATPEGWKSGKPQSEGSFTHTFDQPGTYGYRCTLHGGMDGRVVVVGG